MQYIIPLMVYAQEDISALADRVSSTLLGQAVSYHGSYPGEALVPVAYFVEAVCGAPAGLPFTENNSVMSYFRQLPFNNEVAYPKGTILMWEGGHMGMVMGMVQAGSAEVLEQNASPDSLICGIHLRALHGCALVLVPVIGEEVPLEPPPPPKPYVPPLGAMAVPVVKEPYYVRRSIPGYAAYSNAARHEGAITRVSIGNYLIYRKTAGMLNISPSPGVAGTWIDPADNVY